MARRALDWPSLNRFISGNKGKQFFRYAIVGTLSNVAGYLLYLGITSLGVGAKTAMTFLYLMGATFSFFANRQWTFSHRGNVANSLFRYGLTHLVGYGLNYAMLYILTDNLGYPHQWVQALAVFVVALFLFVAFRFFVFCQVSVDLRRMP